MTSDQLKDNLTKITKRDGRIVAFDIGKIVGAISKSVAETGEFGREESERLAGIVVTILHKANGSHVPTVEQLQDIVEQVLMAGGHYETAKAYILYRAMRKQVRDVREVIGVEDDLGLSLNQLRVIEKRYLMHDEDGKVAETPKQWLTRVARTLAKVEKKGKQDWEKKFFEVMANFEFLPAGRTLNNAGTPQNQLANCFVLPVEDSMEGIFDAVKWTALVHQSGGGTGFNFSKLRPSGDVVSKSSGGFATGPVSFMKVFDVATRQVMQGGKKRGANMGILNVDHPDVMEFITCKTEDGEVANFNISVGVTDEFMKAVEKDRDFYFRNPRTGEKLHAIKARTLMDQIATLAWRTGDPGMICVDTINENNPLLEKYGRIDATNPCGEQPLHAFDACNLGSLNLAKFVNLKLKTQNSKLKTEECIDWERLAWVIRVAVRMLDNVIDAGKYPIREIEKTVKENRRIGLGVMGWADMLFQIGVAYDSKQALKLAEKVMKFVQEKSWEASREIAREKGEFPRWKESSFAKGWDPLVKKFKVQSSKFKKIWKVRNVAITTIAPTGTISMAANTSSGIEPVFALSFVKNVVSEEGLAYVNGFFEKSLDEMKVTRIKKQGIINAVSRSGSVQGVSGVSDDMKRVFVTAHDISWEWHIKIQAAFQKYTDNAVSKTINFPAKATIEEIKQAYMLAWKLKCKGTTVYRDSSKAFQVLSHESGSQESRVKNHEDSKHIIQSKLKLKTLKERVWEGVFDKKKVDECPECGGRVSVQEGCNLCVECGWSVCSS